MIWSWLVAWASRTCGESRPRSLTVRPWARAQWRITEVDVATVMGQVSTLTAEPASAAID